VNDSIVKQKFNLHESVCALPRSLPLSCVRTAVSKEQKFLCIFLGFLPLHSLALHCAVHKTFTNKSSAIAVTKYDRNAAPVQDDYAIPNFGLIRCKTYQPVTRLVMKDEHLPVPDDASYTLYVLNGCCRVFILLRIIEAHVLAIF
jgi:hypothetical protein